MYHVPNVQLFMYIMHRRVANANGKWQMANGKWQMANGRGCKLQSTVH
jgi:hypothetical protein